MGERDEAATVNIVASFATFVAASALTARVVTDGPMLALDKLFFVDSFNVFLVALTAFVGFTTSIFSRPVHAHRARARPRERGAAAPLPQHVPALQLHDAAGAPHQQHGHPVGGARGGDAHHRAARVALPDAGEPRGGVEVLHPVRRRHRPGAVRHDPAVLRGGEAARRGRRRAAVDRARRGQGAARADRALARVRVPARRVRHEGGPGPAAQLAARRARGGPDAGLGRALRAPAQRRALRGRALQGAGRGRDPDRVREEPDDGLRPPVGRRRRVPALAPEGHQAPVRLLVDRAHGHHHVRVRHGRRRSPTSPGCCT